MCVTRSEYFFIITCEWFGWRLRLARIGFGPAKNLWVIQHDNCSLFLAELGFLNAHHTEKQEEKKTEDHSKYGEIEEDVLRKGQFFFGDGLLIGYFTHYFSFILLYLAI